MRKLVKRNKAALKLLGLIALVTLFGRLLVPIVNSPEFRHIVASAGSFGPLIIIFYVILSHVLAPLVGSPMLFLSAGIYGLKLSTIYFFIGGMFSSAINFWIARKYGRKWVVKLAGKDAMRDIDNFVAAEGDEIMIFSRLFGFTVFDFISYAAGLTKIPFKKYYLITNVVGVLPSILIYNVYKNVDLQTERGMMIWAASLLPLTISFTFIIRHYLNKRVEKRTDKK